MSQKTNMKQYVQYIKCGDILIPPSSLNYKHQYILKCGECEKYYSLIEEFLIHFFNHCGGKDIAEYENRHVKSEYDVSVDKEVPRISLDDKQTNNEETYLNTTPASLKASHTSPIKKELLLPNDEHSQNTEDAQEEIMEEQLIDYPDTDDEFKESGDSKSSIFVTNLIKSEEKAKTFIAAYKNQPYLWNSKLPKRTRTKERPKDLQLIAAQLKQINLQITINQVESVIRRLRLIYREQLKSLESKGDAETANSKKQPPPWLMENLDFLKPFMETNSVVKLNCLQPEISKEEIIQLLSIYKRYPNLWNTNLIENCCTNKRIEALEQMESIVEIEMGLKINQNTLKRYIRCIHYHFTREKRRDMYSAEITEGRCEFYKHMTFLEDHVGPFKCCDCKREFKSPLALKVHKSQHDGSIPLKCSMCNKDYRTTEAYMSHARRHMKDLKQQCSECGKKFLKYTELEIHMRSHTGAKPFCCELCGASFRHNHAFATHKRRHEKKFLHSCPICLKGFYKKDHLDNHLRTHGILQDFICETCGKGFKSKKTQQQHELTHKVK